MVNLSKYAQIILNSDNEARIRQLNWPCLDERIETEFNKIKEQKNSCRVFGNIYLTQSRKYSPINSSNLPASRVVNSTHIHTGTRFIGVSIIDQETKKLSVGIEKNAQLWYSQSPSGRVMVFISPYTSNVGKIEENEIIIGKYEAPGEINTKEIKKHFSKFFKYCSCTHQHGAQDLLNYLYRRYLIFNDFRYKATFRTKVLKIMERIITLLLGGAAVLASLYAGGKL